MSEHRCSYTVFRPIGWISRVLGILYIKHTVFEKDHCRVEVTYRSRMTLSALPFLCVNMLLFMCSAYRVRTVIDPDGLQRTDRICFEIFFCMTVLDWMVTLSTSIMKSKDLARFLNKLNQIDHRLQDENEEIVQRNRQHHSVATFSIFALLIFCVVTTVVDVEYDVGQIFTTQKGYTPWLLSFKLIWFIQSDVRMKQFFILGHMLSKRFAAIAEALSKVVQIQEVVESPDLEIGIAEPEINQIRHLRYVHAMCLDLIQEFDHVFRPDILTSLASTTTYVVMLVYMALTYQIFDTTDNHSSVVWTWSILTLSIVIFTRIFGAGYMGDRIANAAAEPLKIIHRGSLVNNLTLEYSIQSLLLTHQITSRDYHPSAAGFFSLNKRMVCTVVSILATYVILLLQFRRDDLWTPQQRPDNDSTPLRKSV